MTRSRQARLEHMEQRVASIDMPRTEEIALRETIIRAVIRTTLEFERLSTQPLFGRRTVAGQVVDDRTSMKISVADGDRRVREMFQELRPLVGLSGEAWVTYMRKIIETATEQRA